VSLHCATERVPADRSDEVSGCGELDAAGSASFKFLSMNQRGLTLARLITSRTCSTAANPCD
jgi:hypothetical protein